MTDLLESDFADLSPPISKRQPAWSLKRRLRRQLLRLAGLLQPRPGIRPRRSKILLIRPDHLGDLLFLTPALRYLRTLLPEAHLSLLVGPWGRAVMENSPYLDQLLVCHFPGFTRQPKPSFWQPYRYLAEQAKQLRAGQFDMAIVLRFDHWWGAWLAAAAGIPHRFGYDIPEVAPFLTDPLPYLAGRHEVEQNWRLIHYAWSLGSLPIIEDWSDREIMGELAFSVPETERAWAKQWLQGHQLLIERPLVIIHPGAGAPVKLWRSEAWAVLAQKLIDQYRCQIILSGGPDEVELCHCIAGLISPVPPISAGQTSLAQLAGLMAEATLAVGSDTGPLKLAAAVGTPTVELYGPVAAQKFGPWGPPAKNRYLTSGLSCIACDHLDYQATELAHHFCVRGLSVEWVLREVVDLLQQVYRP